MISEEIWLNLIVELYSLVSRVSSICHSGALVRSVCTLIPFLLVQNIPGRWIETQLGIIITIIFALVWKLTLGRRYFPSWAKRLTGHKHAGISIQDMLAAAQIKHRCSVSGAPIPQ